MSHCGRVRCAFFFNFLSLHLISVASGLYLRSPSSPLWRGRPVETLLLLPERMAASQVDVDGDRLELDPYSTPLTPAPYRDGDHSFGELAAADDSLSPSPSALPQTSGKAALEEANSQGAQNDRGFPENGGEDAGALSSLLPPEAGTALPDSSTGANGSLNGNGGARAETAGTQTEASDGESAVSTPESTMEGSQSDESKLSGPSQENAVEETTADDTAVLLDQSGSVEQPTGDGQEGGSATESGIAASGGSVSAPPAEESKSEESLQQTAEGETPIARDTAGHSDLGRSAEEPTSDGRDEGSDTEASPEGAVPSPSAKEPEPPRPLEKASEDEAGPAVSAGEARGEARVPERPLQIGPRVQGWTSEFLMKGGDHYRLLRHTDIQGALSRQARDWRPAIDLLHNATSFFSAIRAHQGAMAPPRRPLKGTVPEQANGTPAQETVAPITAPGKRSRASPGPTTPPKAPSASEQSGAEGPQSATAAAEASSEGTTGAETKSTESPATSTPAEAELSDPADESVTSSEDGQSAEQQDEASDGNSDPSTADSSDSGSNDADGQV